MSTHYRSAINSAFRGYRKWSRQLFFLEADGIQVQRWKGEVDYDSPRMPRSWQLTTGLPQTLSLQDKWRKPTSSATGSLYSGSEVPDTTFVSAHYRGATHYFYKIDEGSRHLLLQAHCIQDQKTWMPSLCQLITAMAWIFPLEDRRKKWTASSGNWLDSRSEDRRMRSTINHRGWYVDVCSLPRCHRFLPLKSQRWKVIWQLCRSSDCESAPPGIGRW
jgi:hypothetical protein